MRTVHETEALRPSDPVPKHHSSNPSNKHQKLRLTFKSLSGGTNGTGGGPGSDGGKSSLSVPASPMTGPSHDEEYEHNNVIFAPAPEGSKKGEQGPRQFPPDIHLTDTELSLAADDLYALLKHQLKWATAAGEELRKEVAELEEKRRREWNAKELALENLMEAEAEGAVRRGPVGVPEERLREESVMEVLTEDVKQARDMELKGAQESPWWREPRRQRDGGGGAMEGVESGVQYGTPMVA
jgi:hypothetical protein